jgi:hypothetical protein
MFSHWVRSMVTAIRAAGSKQLIDVGQDEGGVTDRVLNQFYAAAGVSFTTNHTYWNDDALLWDSVVAKRPGIPNITGETGYQRSGCRMALGAMTKLPAIPFWNGNGPWDLPPAAAARCNGTGIENWISAWNAALVRPKSGNP